MLLGREASDDRVKGRRWTEADDIQLEFYWGREDLSDLAARFARTQQAITNRARKLRLQTPSHGTKTMREFCRETGYSEARVRKVAELLGLKFRGKRRSDPRQSRRSRHLAISEEQEQKLLAKLRELKDGEGIFNPEGQRTKKGEWGTGRKPMQCTVCHRANRPHYAKGQCWPCYLRVLKDKKKAKADEQRQVVQGTGSESPSTGVRCRPELGELPGLHRASDGRHDDGGQPLPRPEGGVPPGLKVAG